MDASRATMARMRMTNIEWCLAGRRSISPDRLGKDEPSTPRENERASDAEPGRGRRQPSQQSLRGVSRHQRDGDDESEKKAHRSFEDAHRPAAEIEKGAHQI